MLKTLLLFFLVAQASAKESDFCETQLVPDVYALNSVRALVPQPVRYAPRLSSPGISDSWLKLGRRVTAFDDFKWISDLQREAVSPAERRAVVQAAKSFRRKVFDLTGRLDLAQKAYVRWVINHLYRFEPELRPFRHEIVAPRMHTSDQRYAEAVLHIEKTWSELAKVSPEYSMGSLLPSPFPVVVAGGRFREAYYWDAYFGALGLAVTERWDLVAAQLENFLHAIQTFGRVPNGFRDYYLTRSQPPLISRLAMLVFFERPDVTWLRQRVLPLLQQDYHGFWMRQRFDSGTGLNFYSDDLDEMRPERHSRDDERALGRNFRCVRAQAESGLDFTDALMGECVVSVSLNAFLYRYELDLAAMADMAGDLMLAAQYREAAERRRGSIAKFLWRGGSFHNYDLRSGAHSDVQHADQFAMLFSGAATPLQAQALVENVLPRLERAGGLAASDRQSGKQWDGDHGWAPLQVMAIQGLHNYGFEAQARRLAHKWVTALTGVYGETGGFFEKIDVGRGRLPAEDGTKYPNQTGFLWTNSSYLWALQYLGVPLGMTVDQTQAER